MANLHRTYNNAIGTIQNNPLLIAGTNLIVNNALDTKLNAIGSFPFWVTAWGIGLTPDTDPNREVMEVTARVSPNNYTVNRGQQGTAAIQWAQGSNIGLLWTAGNAQEVVTLDTLGTGYLLYYGSDGLPHLFASGGLGEIIVFGSDNLPHLLTVGSNGKALLANSSATYGVNWSGVSSIYGQQIALPNGSNIARIAVACVNTGITAGGVFYVLQGGTSNTLNIYVMNVDSVTNGIYYSGTTVAINPSGSNILASCVVIGSYVYVNIDANTAVLQRYNAGTLASETNMTVGAGGTGFGYGNGMFTDGTNLYCITATNTVDKYSISGTNLTWVSTITFTGITASTSAPALTSIWCDGTNVYQLVSKWSIGGGSATSIAGVGNLPTVFAGVVLNGSSNFAMYSFNYYYFTASGSSWAYLSAVPITYQ